MKYHAPVPAAGAAAAIGVAAAVGVAAAAGAALAAAAVDVAVCTVPVVDSTIPDVPELVGMAPEPAASVEVDVAALSVAVVLSPGAVVETAAFVDVATVPEGAEVIDEVGEVAAPPPAVGVVLKPDPLVADDARGVADDCLFEVRLRAGPADPVARLGVADVLESLAALGFDEPPSVAADATP